MTMDRRAVELASANLSLFADAAGPDNAETHSEGHRGVEPRE